MTNVSTGDKILYLRDAQLTSFYVRATNDAEMSHVPYLSSLPPFSGATDVS